MRASDRPSNCATAAVNSDRRAAPAPYVAFARHARRLVERNAAEMLVAALLATLDRLVRRAQRSAARFEVKQNQTHTRCVPRGARDALALFDFLGRALGQQTTQLRDKRRIEQARRGKVLRRRRRQRADVSTSGVRNAFVRRRRRNESAPA